jgi:hypothetical protein
MTYKGKVSKKHMDSIEHAIEDAGIRAVHPARMEEFAEYLVSKLHYDEPKNCQSN